MRKSELNAQITIELERLDRAVSELRRIRTNADDEPTVVETTTAGAFHHEYGFELDWSRMKESVERIEHVFSEFRERISEYLEVE